MLLETDNPDPLDCKATKAIVAYAAAAAAAVVATTLRLCFRCVIVVIFVVVGIILPNSVMRTSLQVLLSMDVSI